MNFMQATPESLDQVKRIVDTTIRTIYPNYYPTEVVDFFIQHHREENIIKDIAQERVWLADVKGAYVGTGSIKGKEIGRVFVLPQYQGKGYGGAIMNFLEQKIADHYDQTILDASLPAFGMYVKRGYVVTESHKIEVPNGRFLFYAVMEKDLIKPVKTEICYNGRVESIIGEVGE